MFNKYSDTEIFCKNMYTIFNRESEYLASKAGKNKLAKARWKMVWVIAN